MMKHIILIIIIIILFIVLFNKNKELFDTTTSFPIIQTIASSYDNSQMTISNLSINGTFNMLPRGSIVVWNGNMAPFGWAICDGTNGTPDLRGKFIIGANADTYKLNSTGGQTTKTLSVDELPAHTHQYDDIFHTNREKRRTNLGVNVDSIINVPHNIGNETDINQTNKGFEMSRISDPVGNGKSFSTLPPYYSLIYIMKL